MTDTTSQPITPQTKRNIFQQLELDVRLLGMIGAFIILCIGFNLVTDGRFLTPRNIFNLTIQTVSVAIMASGMVFVIVTRHIDLSVGALLATCSAVMAMTQTEFVPHVLGLGLNHPITWVVAVLVGLVTGTLIGAFHGWMVGYLTIPAFIVTLGGFLVWRNVAWYLTDGQTIGPLDSTFMMFGGINGTLGVSLSWILGIVATVLALLTLWNSRRAKLAHEFPVKPLWAEAVMAVIVSGAILGFVGILNAYEIPSRRLARLFEARGEVMPEGLTMGYGLPISVLILIAVAVVMTIVARRTRRGRELTRSAAGRWLELRRAVIARSLLVMLLRRGRGSSKLHYRTVGPVCSQARWVVSGEERDPLAFSRQLIHCWGFYYGIAVTTKGFDPVVIGNHQNNIRTFHNC